MKIRAYFKLTCHKTFTYAVIHIRQIGEVRTDVSTAAKQNRTKLPKRIQVLDGVNNRQLFCSRQTVNHAHTDQ